MHKAILPTASEAVIESLRKDFERMSKTEEVEVEQINETIYGYLESELAALRILSNYRFAPNFSYGFSENLGCWYVAIDVN